MINASIDQHNVQYLLISPLNIQLIIHIILCYTISVDKFSLLFFFNITFSGSEKNHNK